MNKTNKYMKQFCIAAYFKQADIWASAVWSIRHNISLTITILAKKRSKAYEMAAGENLLYYVRSKMERLQKIKKEWKILSLPASIIMNENSQNSDIKEEIEASQSIKRQKR